MAGFMSGFGQGMSQLPDLMDRKAEREQEMEFKRLTMARQKILDDQKATGDVIAELNSSIDLTPPEQLGQRINLTLADIEQRTGDPIPAAVKSLFKNDPKGAVKTMAELYSQKPFGMAELGKTLSNPRVVAGIMDAMNRKNAATEAAASFSEALPTVGQGGGSVDSAQAIQAALEGAKKASPSTPGFKERISFLEKRLDQLQREREFGLTNPMALRGRMHGVNVDQASPAAMQFLQNQTLQEGATQAGAVEGAQTAARRRATALPLDAAREIQQPLGTTYGDIEAGSTTSGVTPQLLDRLRQVESGGDTFAVNKQSGAMGPYQFMPATVADMHKRGIVFNPFVEEEARAAAGRYLSQLQKENGGDMRKALKAYGGFVTKDPTAYVNKVLGSGSGTAPAQPSLVPPTEADQAQRKDQAVEVGKEFREFQKSSIAAASKVRNAETLSHYLDQVNTGTFAGSVLQLQKLAAAAGFDIPKSADYAEAAKTLSLKMAQEMRDPSQGAGSPGAISNYEQQTFQEMVAGIDKLPGANKLIIDGYKNNQKRTIEIAKLQREYVQSNGGRIDDGIYRVAEEYRAANPLFTPEQVEAVRASAVKPKGKVRAIPKGWSVEEIKE